MDLKSVILQRFKTQKSILFVSSMCAIAICTLYNFQIIKTSLFHLSNTSHITIEDVRDLCTILGIILIPAGWIYNEYQQRTLDQYASKEQKYQVMLRSADALLYEDFRHPEIQNLVYNFIKEFQVCYLYVPDNVIRAGHEFLKSFEELLEEPEEILSNELKETLSADEVENTLKLSLEDIPSNITKHQKVMYEEYLNNRQKELYKEFRDIKYPEFVKAIRKDMMPKRTNLSNEEYIVHIPPHIKIKRHFEFVGKSVAHLVFLLVEGVKNKDIARLNNILSVLIATLEPDFKDISYIIEKDIKIVIFISKKRYNIITFLEKLSISKIIGFEKALEIKTALENL